MFGWEPTRSRTEARADRLCSDEMCWFRQCWKRWILMRLVFDIEWYVCLMQLTQYRTPTIPPSPIYLRIIAMQTPGHHHELWPFQNADEWNAADMNKEKSRHLCNDKVICRRIGRRQKGPENWSRAPPWPTNNITHDLDAGCVRVQLIYVAPASSPITNYYYQVDIPKLK